jgi:hypothetical protein
MFSLSVKPSQTPTMRGNLVVDTSMNDKSVGKGKGKNVGLLSP